MDVPEFNDELVDLIATQSDEQANGLSIRELEKIRDDNLVAIMEALSKQNKGKGWGAGALYNDYHRQAVQARRQAETVEYGGQGQGRQEGEGSRERPKKSKAKKKG